MSDPAEAARRPRVLVVDDEDLLRWSIVTQFAEAGFDVAEASSVRSGLAVGAESLDAAVIDYRLPDGTGIELVAGLHAEHPTLPVVLMTAYRNPTLQPLADGAGIRAVLDKPFVVKKVVDLVRGYLEGSSVADRTPRRAP